MNQTVVSPTKSRKKASSLYELGKLRWELGDFQNAVPKLRRASQLYAELREHMGFIKSLTLCLRMFAEMEDQTALEEIKNQLYDHVTRERIALNSCTYYALALATSYRGEYGAALQHLERALALALEVNSKEEMCYAMNGMAAVYWSMGRTEDALREIHNLTVFFEVLHLPDLEISSQILNGYILVSLKKYGEALDVFWGAFESAKDKKNLYTYVSLLFAMAFAYVESGEIDQARPYVGLAQRMADPKNFTFLVRRINELNERISGKGQGTFDLVLNSSSNSVVERKKGRVEFKNQFILLDMLKVFLRTPGQVHTKEQLTRAIWKQEYDPSVHDNKIYVTIKRLRQMIEPDFDKPRYIYRAKNGYYLNRNARVAIETR